MLNILLATSEAVPLAKTGGLGDVCGALPLELARLGHRAAVILPAYREALQAAKAAQLPLEALDVVLEIPIGTKTVYGRLLKTHLPGGKDSGGDVPVYLVDQPDYFDRDGIYGERGQEYKDNCERFVFFSRAVVEAIRLVPLKVDVLHANDWPTGLIPAYLKVEYRGVPGYEDLATLMTIHNLAYQGVFWHWDMLLTGLDWKYFNWHQMEFFGNLNLLKTGLVFADALNTVSPRYAEEIQSAPRGEKLEGVLQQRRDVLSGILNGVDYNVWDPAIDPHLPRNYRLDDVHLGKAACKVALQKELGLPQKPEVPLVVMISRLADQKGLDLVEPVIKDWVNSADVQWAFLGTGDAKYHELLGTLAQRNPHKVAARLKFDTPLSHRFEAGGDIFLMPSNYEPCGLNQLYSLKYGTVPVVRATGGLADTITNATDENLAAGTANGFSFRDYSPLALSETLRRACDVYRQRPDLWRQLIATGMTQDWSWARSARQYVELYQRMLARKRQGVATAGRSLGAGLGAGA